MLPANASFRRRGAAALTYPQKIMELGPLAYWRMNIASGVAIPDESTGGTRGATINSGSGSAVLQQPSLISGQPSNKSIGLTNQWLAVANADASIGFTGCTYSFVVKPSDLGSSVHHTLFHIGDYAVSNNQGCRVVLWGDSKKLEIDYFASGAWRGVAGNFVYTLGTATHIVVRFVSSLSVEVFCNGALVDTLTLPVAIAMPPSQRTLKIGVTKESSNTKWFKGDMDDCAVFNRLLSATEINDLYASRLVS